MAEIEPGPDNDYQVQSTATFSRAVWNAVMASIAARLKARELLEATFETLIENGVQAALDMISQNVAPQLSSLTTQINDLEKALEDLISGGTAPNALQLGGQNPAYYLALANATGSLPVAQVSGVEALISAAVAGLVNSAPTTLDTLKELSDALGGDANFATHMAEALGFRLRVDAVQSLTTEQKAQAFSNLGFAPGDYYTKTEISSGYYGKSDVYTKIEINSQMAGKFNTTGGATTGVIAVNPTTNVNAEFSARYNGQTNGTALGQDINGDGYIWNYGHRWSFFRSGWTNLPGGLGVYGDAHIYSPNFEIEGSQADGAWLWLHRQNVKRAAWHVAGDGTLHWLDQGGTSHFRVRGDGVTEAVSYATTGGANFANDGNIWMPWAGTYLSSHISNMRSGAYNDAWNNIIPHVNGKVHGMRWTGGGDIGYSPGNWVGGGSGEVVKGVHSSASVAGGVDAVRIRYLQFITNDAGWVTVGDA